MMTIFVCRDEFDSILCGVYDAWTSGLGHENVRLETEKDHENETLQMFSQYRQVEEAAWKARTAAESVKKKISYEAYAWIYRASLCCERHKADKIYRFFVQGSQFGSETVKLLKNPAVYDVFAMNRRAANEAHLLTGFLRFSQLRSGFLAAVAAPENNVLSLLAAHFSDRMPGERWLIFDEKRGGAAIHEPGRGFVILTELPEHWKRYFSEGTDSGEFEELWKIFHSAVSIRERENRACQRTHLPLRFRPYMTEF